MTTSDNEYKTLLYYLQIKKALGTTIAESVTSDINFTLTVSFDQANWAIY